MYLTIADVFKKIKDWFNDIIRPIKSFFKPIGDWFWNFSSPVRNFFIEHARNPFLWISIILIGLIVFELTYKALSKDR